MNKHLTLTHHCIDQFTEDNQYSNFVVSTINSDFREKLVTPHRNSFYQIILLEQGSATYHVDFETYQIEAPTTCFIFPQQVVKVVLSDDAHGKTILFDDTIFCSEILASELKEYNVDLHKRINQVNFSKNEVRFDEINTIYKQIDDLSKSLNELRRIEVKFLIKTIIFKIIDTASNYIVPMQKSRSMEHYISFRQLVDDEFMTQRKVSYYCSQLNISAKLLNSVCREFADKTALEIIHDRLSNEIKKIFVFEDLTLKEIAFQLGFDSQPALNKYIASKFGCSPSELREQIINRY